VTQIIRNRVPLFLMEMPVSLMMTMRWIRYLQSSRSQMADLPQEDGFTRVIPRQGKLAMMLKDTLSIQQREKIALNI